MLPEHFEHMLYLIQIESPGSRFFNPPGVVDSEGEGRVVGGQLKLYRVVEELLHIAQSVVRDCRATTVSDAVNHFANVKGCHVLDLEFADDGLDVFVEDSGGDTRVLQSREQVIPIPVLEQVIDAGNSCPFLALFGDQGIYPLAKLAFQNLRFCSGVR